MTQAMDNVIEDPALRRKVALLFIAAVALGIVLAVLGQEPAGGPGNGPDGPGDNGTTGDDSPSLSIQRQLPDSIKAGSTVYVGLSYSNAAGEDITVMEQIEIDEKRIERNISIDAEEDGKIVYPVTIPANASSGLVSFTGSVVGTGTVVAGDSETTLRATMPRISLEDTSYGLQLRDLLPQVVANTRRSTFDSYQAGGRMARRGLQREAVAEYGGDDWSIRASVGQYNTSIAAERQLNRDASSIRENSPGDVSHVTLDTGTSAYVIDDIGQQRVLWGHGDMLYEVYVTDGDPAAVGSAFDEVFENAR